MSEGGSRRSERLSRPPSRGTSAPPARASAPHVFVSGTVPAGQRVRAPRCVSRSCWCTHADAQAAAADIGDLVAHEPHPGSDNVQGLSQECYRAMLGLRIDQDVACFDLETNTYAYKPLQETPEIRVQLPYTFNFPAGRSLTIRGTEDLFRFVSLGAEGCTHSGPPGNCDACSVALHARVRAASDPEGAAGQSLTEAGYVTGGVCEAYAVAEALFAAHIKLSDQGGVAPYLSAVPKPTTRQRSRRLALFPPSACGTEPTITHLSNTSFS